MEVSNGYIAETVWITGSQLFLASCSTGLLVRSNCLAMIRARDKLLTLEYY